MTSETPSGKRKIDTLSAYKISNKDNFDFSATEYSKFKFGANDIARIYGHKLAECFIEQKLKKDYKGRQLVILPSAYSHIPTASFYMKTHFVDRLNHYLYKNSYPVLQESKIYRTVTYREDYGQMSATERYKLICGDTFYVDKNYLADKILIFIDDIKITGTHERIIIKMLDEHKVYNPSYMLYLAELVDQSIDPSIENYLNLHFIKELADVDFIIKEHEFEFNSRVVKYILNSKPEEFDKFIAKQKTLFLQQLYYNVVGNEYFKFEAYLRNINILEQIFDKK